MYTVVNPTIFRNNITTLSNLSSAIFPENFYVHGHGYISSSNCYLTFCFLLVHYPTTIRLRLFYFVFCIYCHCLYFISCFYIKLAFYSIEGLPHFSLSKIEVLLPKLAIKKVDNFMCIKLAQITAI